MPVAVNCRVNPAASVGLVGVTAIETRVAVVTVNTTGVLVTPLNVAVILLVPAACVVANPPDTMVATDVLEELHITELVMSNVELSEYVPVAVYCCVKPAAILAVVGVTVIELNVAAVTVNVLVGLVTPLNVAVMLVVPAAMVVANPPDAMVATLGVAEAHVTDDVMFTVVPSVYVPVAVNCCVNPAARETPVGVVAIETNVADVTVNVAELLVLPLSVAVMFAVPAV